MSSKMLAFFFLLSTSVWALPGPTSDAKGVADGLPGRTVFAAIAQMPPERFLHMLGQATVNRLADDAGLSSEALSQACDGRGFVAVFDGAMVFGLGLKSPLQAAASGIEIHDGWLLMAAKRELDPFTTDSSTLAQNPGYQKVAGSWPGGELLLYSGDLWTPSPRYLAEMKVDAKQLMEMVGPAPPCPHACLGVADSRLQGWVDLQLAPSVPAGTIWSSTLENDNIKREAPAQLCAQFAEQGKAASSFVTTLMERSLHLPIEWQLYVSCLRGLQNSRQDRHSLAMALLTVFTREEMSPSRFQEALEAKGDGLWHYSLDATQTAELGKAGQRSLWSMSQHFELAGSSGLEVHR